MAEAAENLQEQEEQEQQEQQEHEETVDVDSLMAQREQHQQEIAAQHGWKPLDEWVKSGGDPNDWRPAGEFNQVGEFGRKLKQRDQQHTEELQNAQKYTQALRKQLERELDQAVDNGDKETAKSLREDIQNLDRPVPRKPQEVIDWEERNPEVYEDSPKGAFMREQWQRMLPSVQQGKMSMSDALKALDQKVETAFPKPTQTRGKVPASERGNGSRGVRPSSGKAVTMDDLTQEEAYIWKTNKDMWKGDEKAFLKSVTAMRKEA